MIVGIGIDIIDIGRISLKIADRILTGLEKGKKLNAQYLAGRFSLKEAFFKALGTGLNGNSFKDISILNNDEGKPYIVLHKDFEGFNFCHVSLSHDTFALSNVILEKRQGNVFLGIGTNLGEKEKNLSTALDYLEKVGIKILKTSSIYITKPYGYTNQDNFYNIVVEIDTVLSPKKLLECLLKIEKNMGRKRTIKWGPRIIDIDILFYGNLVIDLEKLKIPHYDFVNRDFFVVPMVEISKDFVHPKFGKTIESLMGNFEKNWEVIDWKLRR
ncbi:7,8-dihydro-6-hydroxymethylpterin-pyrophosphokinase [Thermosipho melanesiensis]|uniref:Holo-[acyl-carrier-protein] synthase n=2 Tax=Thermosipho melanesiensis TaxID=46541 RepID=A6LP46_THEM4|nr:2-amino-4-hydroxy-6-hydroxymethyldihydropteridine diphosphokinase [Thermosipho melanesiensis]ABR31697.1 2-amino-4-hydroxy-6-hydroxymethyldihydropteridine pyrophosphokinase [Thermosipho melanesiensis BI429]APT74720.1 7,8-dihydro-6-hydroxymethylpterin-pyrophosphokinase [Thermosipho melanesiensis]OOC35221.1 7,8-dihydro-6-hydroxymethylpterin-pyrophosphokinase [Thermosipho melanesiensis]OOC35431.1 7,8-dihydro-6-hydroxymethylpterin-pyrophosphokinase [Thermosipho melanesiensis]OOC36682.1 7,8-dihyd